MTYWELLFLFLGFQAILLSLLFYFKRAISFVYGNRLFAVFLFLCGWLVVYNVLFWSKKLAQLPFVHINHSYVIPLSLIGPLFFLYIRNIVHGTKISLRKDFIHFIPTLTIMIVYGPYFLLSAGEKLNSFNDGPLASFHPSGLYEVAFVVLMAIYGIYIVVKYFNFFANDGDLQFWVKAITFSYLGCVLSYISYYSLYYLGILTLEQDYYITLLLCISVMIAAYFAFNYPDIFQGKSIGEVVPFMKYKKTGLSKKYSKELKESLLDHMIKEKPFLNRELRLDDLANSLGIARHHASQIINEHFDANFFDFINLYRVEEAIKLLEEKKDLVNLAEIGFLSGFNNTVSFNKAFKKSTGVTPSKFRKELMSNNY
ncbi:MAG: helix-turn-helix domain-containing protein [Allomuricauda sp.]